jgi:acyl-CoA thioesterase YciA
MDLAGGTLAAERAGGAVVTVAIEAMRFLRPVAVGDEVSCYCTLGEVGATSIPVRIETWARKRGGRQAEKVTEGVFTYVAVDEEGHPRTLPDSSGEVG